MKTMNEQIAEIGIIPVVVLNNADDAEPLAEALIKGGLAAAEVTFRTDAAEESIRRISSKYPEMLVGAGTCLTIDQVDRAVAAGAKFIVAPGLNPTTVKHCQEIGVPMIPGVVTPSEIELAMSLGLDTVKFFPAEPSGGLKMIQAMTAAYTTLKVMPTGGINASNVREYLKDKHILACGGSWMVKGDMIKAGEFEKIAAMTKEAADIVREVRG